MPTVTEQVVNPLHLPPQEFETWLRASGRTIGGTAVGAICGIDPDKKAWDVWDQIFRPVLHARNRRMDRGHAMEPIIAEIYAEETGRVLHGDGQQRVPHRIFWFGHATIDRRIGSSTADVYRIDPPHRPNSDGVLEIKCLGTRTFQETKEEGIAPKYYAQLQWYLDALGLEWGSFAIFNAEEWQLYWFDVEYDAEFCRHMHVIVDQFWVTHVMGRERPVDGSLLTVMPRPHIGSESVIIEGNTTWTNALAELQRAAEDKKLSETRFENARNVVKTLMEGVNHERVRVPGVGTVNWLPSVTRTVDRDRLAAEHPEINLASFMRVTESRTFTFRPERTRR